MSAPLRIGLSIDFDFFCYEDPAWDLGHNEDEHTSSNAVWMSRYLHIDLQKECDIASKADFEPIDVINRLDEKGIRILKNTPLGVADSHKYAYKYFQDMGNNLDLILNLDAHHDSWPMKDPDFDDSDVDCGNWVTALDLPTIWVHPNWADPKTLPDPISVKQSYAWKDFNFTDNNIVMGIFLCRSSAWVPPHLDDEFGEMLHELSKELYPEYLQYPKVRQGIDYKILARERKKIQRMLYPNG
jgi:hypothetical protein